MGKRARERARQERQEAKKQRREIRSDQADEAPAVDEGALMEEFRRLSERYAAEQVGEQHYLDERHRIFVELGIETDQD